MVYGAVSRGHSDSKRRALQSQKLHLVSLSGVSMWPLSFLTVHFLAEKSQRLLLKVETLQVCMLHGCICISYVSGFVPICGRYAHLCTCCRVESPYLHTRW